MLRYHPLQIKKNDSMGVRFIMRRYYLLPMKSIRLDNNCLCSYHDIRTLGECLAHISLTGKVSQRYIVSYINSSLMFCCPYFNIKFWNAFNLISLASFGNNKFICSTVVNINMIIQWFPGRENLIAAFNYLDRISRVMVKLLVLSVVQVSVGSNQRLWNWNLLLLR